MKRLRKRIAIIVCMSFLGSTVLGQFNAVYAENSVTETVDDNSLDSENKVESEDYVDYEATSETETTEEPQKEDNLGEDDISVTLIPSVEESLNESDSQSDLDYSAEEICDNQDEMDFEEAISPEEICDNQDEMDFEEAISPEEYERLDYSEVSINATECELWAIGSKSTEQIPANLQQSFQIVIRGSSNVSYSIYDGNSVTVSDTGLIKPKIITMYRYQSGVYFCVTDTPQGGGWQLVDSWTEVIPGKTWIQVITDNRIFYFEATVNDYGEEQGGVDVEQVISDYLGQHYNSSMSAYEKVVVAAQFSAQYDYGVNSRSLEDMIAQGSGDCILHSAAVVEACKQMGINAWIRPAMYDSASTEGTNHHNVIVDAGNGVYYQVETANGNGYYRIQKRTSLFCYRPLGGGNELYTNDDTYTGDVEIYQYDGDQSNSPTTMDELVVPGQIDGHPVKKIAMDFSWTYKEKWAKSLVISEGIEDLEAYIRGYNVLEEISIPSTLTSMTQDALSCWNMKVIHCSSANPSFSASGGILYNKNKTKVIYGAGVADLDFPSTVTEIGQNAFEYNSKLYTVDIPASVTKIGELAFCGCDNLYLVNIPASVTCIEERAFPSTAVIYGIPGSVAETYANENNIRFVATGTTQSKTVTLSQNAMSMEIGQSIKLTAAVSPSGNQNEVEWKACAHISGAGDAVSVNQNGVVKGLAEGTAVILCRLKSDPSCYASCSVTVKPRPTQVTAVSFRLSEQWIPIDNLGYCSTQLYPENVGYTVDDGEWTIGNENIITTKGCEYWRKRTGCFYFRALSPGTTTVTRSVGGATESCTIHVYRPIEELKFNPTEITLAVGQTYKANPTICPSNATERGLQWGIKNGGYGVISVDQNGNVTAKAPGTAYVYCGATKRRVVDRPYENNWANAYLKVTVFSNSTPSTPASPSNPQYTPTQAFADRLYSKCLGRTPDASGLQHWDQALRTKQRTGASVAYGFVFSEEYKNKHTSNEEFVDMLYAVFMDRQADAGGRAHWISYLNNGMSREYVFRGFAQSQEYTNICASYGIERGSVTLTQARDKNPQMTAYVNRMYTQALGRSGEEGGLNHWCCTIQQRVKTPEQVAESFILSQEFKNKHLSDEEYIKVLYRTFMGREYDAAGLAHWKSELAKGCSRENILHRFATSKEFRNIQASFGL